MTLFDSPSASLIYEHSLSMSDLIVHFLYPISHRRRSLRDLIEFLPVVLDLLVLRILDLMHINDLSNCLLLGRLFLRLSDLFCYQLIVRNQANYAIIWWLYGLLIYHYLPLLFLLDALSDMLLRVLKGPLLLNDLNLISRLRLNSNLDFSLFFGLRWEVLKLRIRLRI